MKALFLPLFLLATIAARSQSLIADETTMEETKTSVKIVSSNYFMADSVISKFEPHLTRYAVSYKKDRHGRYREITIIIPIERRDDVIKYIQSLKRPRE